MNEPAPKEEALFHAALALPRIERPRFLDGACGGDRALRGRLEALLRADHAAEADFLNSPLAELGEAGAKFELLVEEKPGDRIGRYKLLQKIGEGGCGVVYMAEQEEAVRRQVALKIIKLGMDTKAVMARFEAERQALARMEHLNIARVLDAGATLAGRPFFVMELVRGLRITEYCDQNHLGTEARLDLFIKVCHAIQHAHQKGVIHRDIKPSNILVTLHDGVPVPKVIDFGIAKATQGRLTERTLFTAFEQFIGTPAYVSPEQAEMSGLDIDTRSDIYSLGVLLYELLTGRTPFDTAELTRAGIDEMRRTIREQEPPRPSARLRTLTDSDRTTVAQRRGTDAPRLTLRLRGDLDWIVMRCLEKDRSRRYETANALAMDIQRHLRHEPVLARPPSTAYLLRKLIRRHRIAFAAGVTVALVLAAGFTVSTVLFLRERGAREQARQAEMVALREKARAEIAHSNEARLRAEAEAGEKRAQDDAARRARLAAVMTDTLKDIGLLMSLGGDRRALREILDQTAGRKRELADQPEIEAGVDETLGGVYFRLGEYNRAEALFREALDLRRKAQGEGAPEVARSLNYLGLVYSGQSRWAEAERCHESAAQLLRNRWGPEHPDVARTYSTLGWVLAQQAKLAEAEHYLRMALEQQRHLLGAEHPDVAATMTRLGSVLTQHGQVVEAEEALRGALAINRKVFGWQSMEAAGSLNFLAVTVAVTQLRLPEAITLYREATEIRRQLGTNSPEQDSTVKRLAQRDLDGRPQAPDSRSATMPGTRTIAPATLEALLTQRGGLREVEAALRDAQQFGLSQYGTDSWEGAFYLALTAWVLLYEEMYDEAEAMTRQSLAIRMKLRPDDWSTFHARHMLGFAKAGQKQFAEAEPLLIEGYQGMKARAETIPSFHQPRLGEAVQRIIFFYEVTKRPAEALQWQREFDSLEPEARKVLLPPTGKAIPAAK